MSVWVVNTLPLVFLGGLGYPVFLCQEGREVVYPTGYVTWMCVREISDPMAVTLVEAVLHRRAKSIASRPSAFGTILCWRRLSCRIPAKAEGGCLVYGADL